MKGIQPSAFDAVSSEANWRTALGVLDEEYFKEWIDPGRGTLDGPTVPVPGERASVIELPDAASSNWRTNLRRKDRWFGCGIRLTLYYSSTVGSTNDFRLLFGVRAFDVGSDVSGLADIATTTFSTPGPAVAATVLSVSKLYAPPIIPGNRALLTVRVVRLGADAADTNVNPLRVYGLLFEALPGSA
jgi:hypothetical protein